MRKGVRAGNGGEGYLLIINIIYTLLMNSVRHSQPSLKIPLCTYFTIIIMFHSPICEDSGCRRLVSYCMCGIIDHEFNP
jgi:hypothetical protein